MTSILIYRDHLLPASETFILRTHEHHLRYPISYAGIARVSGGLEPKSHPVHTMRTEAGRLEELRYRLTGRSPWLERVIAEADAALIHAHFGKSAARVLPTARALKLPLIVSFHGADVTKEKHFKPFWQVPGVYNLRRPALLRDMACALFDSGYLRQRMIDRGAPAERCAIHYTGIDTAAYEAGPPLEERRPEVLFVGRFVAKKGIATLAKAWAEVAPQRPGLGLTMVGDGPLRGEVEAMAASLPSVRLLGWLAPAEVRERMREALIVTIPSEVAPDGDCEGLPNTVFEAAASGTPVAVTDHSGIPEAVTDGHSGLMVKERDAGALARALLSLSGDAELWRSCSANARARAEGEFDTRLRAKVLDGIYATVLAGGVPAVRPGLP